jgi:membrane protein
MSEVWNILKSAINGFIANEALTRGAAISFYAVTSLTPVLLIVVAVAGIAFGSDLVRDSLIREMSGVLGQESGELVKSMLAKSSDPKTGTSATIFGVVTAGHGFRCVRGNAVCVEQDLEGEGA